MRITDRYAGAIYSSNLRSDERTNFSDTDVLGAMGLASRRHPLAVALTRLFSGDNSAAVEIVDVLAGMVRSKARALHLRIAHTQAYDIAQACLAWHRDGVCKPCGGHGAMKIPGSPAIGTQQCKSCRGVGKMPFEKQFHESWRVLARWLVAEIEREQAEAGPAAMAAIAPKLDL